MIIYESFLEKTLVRKLLGGLSPPPPPPPEPPPLPTALRAYKGSHLFAIIFFFWNICSVSEFCISAGINDQILLARKVSDSVP